MLFLIVTEEQKYRAYTYNVAGFALLSPTGKIVLSPISTFSEFGAERFFIYLLFCIILGFIGFRSIAVGRDILDH